MQNAGQGARRARVELERLKTLLRAAQSPEGRRHHLAPLLMLCGAAGVTAGVALGWHRQRPR